MNDLSPGYWLGVLTGFVCSIFFVIITCFILHNHVMNLQAQMNTLKKEHQRIETWIADNERVMRTYEFFNQSWQAILDERNRKEEQK